MRKIATILLYIFCLLIHFFARTRRLFGIPPFDNRIISYNWIPFWNFGEFIQQQGYIIAIGKILFYLVLGIDILLIIYQTKNRKKKFWFVAISTIILEELLNLTFCSARVVVFNINNVILYLTGLLVAYWLGLRFFPVLQSKLKLPKRHN